MSLLATNYDTGLIKASPKSVHYNGSEEGSYVLRVSAIDVSAGASFDYVSNQLYRPRVMLNDVATFPAKTWMFKRLDNILTDQQSWMSTTDHTYYIDVRFLNGTYQSIVLDQSVFDQASYPTDVTYGGSSMGHPLATFVVEASDVQPFHEGLRRALTPIELNPYGANNNNDGIRHHLWEANRQPGGIGTPVPRGDFGYIRIKSKATNYMHWMVYNEGPPPSNPNYINYTSYIGSQTLKPFNNDWGLEWDDGNTYPDEHVFQITYNPATSNFSVVNTKYTNKYFPWYSSAVASTDRPLNFSYTASGWHINISTNNEHLYTHLSSSATGYGTVRSILLSTLQPGNTFVQDSRLFDFDFL